MPDIAAPADKSAKPPKKQRGIAEGFVAPDGGWGWCVVLAAGCSNLSTFPVLQQFGLLFRERLTTLGLSGKEITTIINLNSCLTSCLGLLNGPMFRIFSYRQVAFFGALLAAIGVLCTSVAGSFGAYVLTFSVLYGAGTGINQSANALALNTYFREKRRIATGISWTATALGPIIFPQVIAVLIPAYGVQNTVLMFGCLALVAVGLAMVYQPVEWHTKPAPADAEQLNGAPTEEKGDLCKHCCLQRPIDGYAIVDPGTPMLSGANDGWFSTTPAKRSLYSSQVSLATGFVSARTSYANVQQAGMTVKPPATAPVINNVEEVPVVVPEVRLTRSKDSKRDKLKQLKQTNELKIEEAETEDCPSFKAPQDLADKDKELQPLTSSVVEPTSNGSNPINNEPTTRTKPMFIINDGFKRKPGSGSRGTTTTVSRLNSNQPSDAIDELLAGTPVGWLTVKSNVPSRNQSALSIFDMTPRRNFSTTSFHGEKEVLRKVRNRLEQYMSTEDDLVGEAGVQKCTCGAKKLLHDDDGADEMKPQDLDTMTDVQYTWWQRVFIFFDLDLLRDWSYVNLMVGVTMASFAELNYSILTPFVLADYGLTKTETATSMSLLGACDISVRFFVPFIAGHIGWENKTFFLFGVMGMALGRISIAHFHSYYAVLAASVWIGLNKGLRTVFMALVIPSYIPLERLPGATGLQLLFAGMFYFVVGPVIGWIRDTTNYTVTLHCLNIATFTTAICWGLEKWYQERRAHKKPQP